MNGIKVSEFYLPGDIIKNIKSKDRETIIGPGLCRHEQEPNILVASQAGNLCFRPPNIYWLESRTNRYIPRKADLVVGIVIKKSSDALRVDIGSAESAFLSTLAFEGATKKMKPEVNVGDVVYAKVLNAYKEMEPELVCIDQYYKAGRLGILPNDGFLININQNLTEMLLNVENPLLRTLGKKFPYEIVVGVNGKVWVRANESKEVLMLCRTFEQSQKHSEKAIFDVCKQVT